VCAVTRITDQFRGHSLSDKVVFKGGDFFVDALPKTDVIVTGRWMAWECRAFFDDRRSAPDRGQHFRSEGIGVAHGRRGRPCRRGEVRVPWLGVRLRVRLDPLAPRDYFLSISSRMPCLLLGRKRSMLRSENGLASS
jgi:hypothetical protein